MSVLLLAAGIIDRSGQPLLPELTLPEGSCEFRLWCQMMPLHWSDPIPCVQQASLDLRRRKAGKLCQGSSCPRCEELARLHPQSSRWLQLVEEAKAQASFAALKAKDSPVVVNIRYGKRIAPIVLPREPKVSVAAVLSSFSFRLCASQQWPRCAACRRLQHCAKHLEQLQEILLPAVIPAGTCSLQLWQGLAQVCFDEDLNDLETFSSAACVAKVDPKCPPCLPGCPRCAAVAEADPNLASVRARRHFWRCKRGAFLLRCGLTTGTDGGLASFLQRACPELVFQLMVSFL